MDSIKTLEEHIERLKVALERAYTATEFSYLSREIRDAIEQHWRMTRPATIGGDSND